MSFRRALWPYLQLLSRRIGPVHFDDPRRATPVSRLFGAERGTPIDRRYIERFLERHRGQMNGVLLEVGSPDYARKFGRAGADVQVLHFEDGADGATIVGDLTVPESLPAGVADCFICTQTFNFVFDVAAAMRGAEQLLRPGGTLLATVAGLCQISRYDADRWGDFWRFTTASSERLARSCFAEVEVQSFGNVLAAKALLDGVAAEELPDPTILDAMDPDYPVVIGIKATKRA